MRVLLVAYGSRGDVEPMLGLGAELRALGAEVQVCAPPDFAELLDGAGIPLVPLGRSLRAMATGAVTGTGKPLPAESLSERAARMVAETYESAAAVAEGCDVVVATGLIPAAAAARSVAEKLGVPYVFVAYFPTYLPSPHHPPLAWPGRPLPPEVTDNRVLWDLNTEHMNALFGEAINTHRAAIGLPSVENVRDHVFTDRPWLAADPTLSPWPQPADLDVVQTGAWIRPDDRPLPADLGAFLDAGAPPVYVGFGSMPVHDAQSVARTAVEAVRAQGRRVLLSRGWADLTLTDDRDDCFAVGEVNQQALFTRVAAVVHHGGAGTTTTAARAGAPQVVVPQMADQPYWAGRVAELGIGVAHDGPTLTYESLSAALKTALNPGTRVRAAAVADTVRTGGATAAAELLRDRVGRGRQHVSAPHPAVGERV
ncbi:vancomycin aglycone glucosyltransferase [Streptomyces sp. 1114.5]|uniref:glycosyltransferase n=1 Tax=unclassified Streptomyces TaxID=2593676 RepID=UPI000BC5B2EB|nr:MULTISPECIES: glycosyltransferase [unclassified Streptomyces]RKT19512.1 vancomycin aglycone glucosyltransferase [Streptomyces sp. 1114.5]SOB85708.1 vancomycin aglycone glucosyltransferase [Streptomyces sp. 1331.2]